MTRAVCLLLAAAVALAPSLALADGFGRIDSVVTSDFGAPVRSPAPTNGQVLKFSSSTGTWSASAVPASAPAFPLLGPADSAAAPDYSWSANANRGVFNDATNGVGFSVGGAERAFVSATGLGFPTALGAVAQIAGPTDQTLLVQAGALQQAQFVAGAGNLGNQGGDAYVIGGSGTNGQGGGVARLRGGPSDATAAGLSGNASIEIGTYAAPSTPGMVTFFNPQTGAVPFAITKWAAANTTSFLGGSGSIIGFSNNVGASVGAADTGLSRDAAGVVDFGTGAQGSVAGSWKATSGTLTGTLTLTGATITGAPTWSSSQAITLSTAAQPNVTSVGTLAGLTMTGTLSMSSTPVISGSPACTLGATTVTTLGTAGNVTLAAGNHLVLATTGAGTQIGTGTTQLLGFYGTTAVAQTAGSTDVLAGLVTVGLRAASSNPPLNLGTGALTAGTSNLGTLSYQRLTVTKTASTYAVTTADTGTHFNNNGAGATVTFTLPASAVNLTYAFYVATAQSITVKGNGSDTIRQGASVSTATTGNVNNSVVGGYIMLVCHVAGQWVAIAGTQGTWTVV